MKKIILLLTVLFLFSCENQPATHQLEEGNWRLVLDLGSGKQLPVNVIINKDQSITIKNATEEIVVTEVSIKQDSIFIQPPVFEGVFKGKFETKNLITGVHIKPSLDRVVPFKMLANKAARFENVSSKPVVKNITGSYETVFSPNNDADRYIAKGVFTQTGNQVTGTFETTTGDYRFLEGIVTNDSLKLSTFDGAHAFLFEAAITDSTIIGDFYSGNHWKEPFEARLNNDYELPDAKELTYLKDGYDTIDFSFKNVDGEVISVNDTEFQNQVVIVQLLGTWCPNCLEETRFYQQYLNQQKTGVKFIGLAFEYARSEKAAMNSIQRLIKSEDITYPILLAQYGTTDKETANEKLPMLNHVLSYPTSIYIDKKGKVRRIHTGYNGLATGSKHERFQQEFYSFMEDLLAE